MNSINLLWTSGWDSTFRLLQIILIEKKTVQPIYIIDKTRKSLKVELERIELIKGKIKQLYPESYQYILPVWYVDEEITINNEIAESSKYINSFIRLGKQYSWLAQFCKNHKLNNIEISNDKNLNKNSLTYFLMNNYIETNYESTTNKEKYNHTHTVFQYFSFPVAKISKREMLHITRDNKWDAIMNLTWFCHKPKNKKPCGRCVPCINVIKKGMGFRIPFFNRLRGYFKIHVKHRLKFSKPSTTN
ncbi:adenine nucleotide alpha hydrolase family protein [Flavobacterium flavipallidum]|uniref:7-cyano-7-deazaguanine synthase n=1 Tax=Flavobacterium flavipallidum TaxID=3139140 RepID=A0ABU9HP82_9FLAO